MRALGAGSWGGNLVSPQPPPCAARGAVKTAASVKMTARMGESSGMPEGISTLNFGNPPHTRDRRWQALVRVPGALRALPSILHLRFRHRLPLHVTRRVRAAGAERDDVIDDVAGPAVRIAGAAQEFILGFPVPMDLAARVTRAVRRLPGCAVRFRRRVAARSWRRARVAAGMAALRGERSGAKRER